MNIVILPPDQYKQWNDFVDNSPQGDVFCYSWWLDAMTDSNFKIYAIFSKDKIVAGMPLAFDTENRINVPPLTRTLGILFQDTEYSSKQKQVSVERKWLNELIKVLKKYDFIQICTHHNFTDWLPFKWNGFQQTTRCTYLIDYLQEPVEMLWKRLDYQRRRMINRAIQNGIRVRESDDFELVYRFVQMSYNRQGMKFPVSYEKFKKLDDALVKNGKRAILEAFDDSKTHAVIYVVYNKKSAYYLISGSNAELRKTGGHTLVLWNAVNFFYDKVRYFNFGGSDIERIESHIRGFGGTLRPYFHIYNEMFIQQGFSYHLKQMSFHLSASCRILKSKIFKYTSLN